MSIYRPCRRAARVDWTADIGLPTGAYKQAKKGAAEALTRLKAREMDKVKFTPKQ